MLSPVPTCTTPWDDAISHNLDLYLPSSFVILVGPDSAWAYTIEKWIVWGHKIISANESTTCLACIRLY
jgi:hypothetical protein